MYKKVKTYLKSKSRSEVKQIVQHPDLTEIEKWLIYYTYGEDRMVINTCYKLGLSEAQYFNTQKLALTKLYYILGL